MSIAAGKLRHRVAIQNYAYIGQDPVTGAEQREWQTFHECWASIEPLSAREFIAAQANQSKVTARITVRYVGGLNSTMRIQHTVRGKQRTYNIDGVLADMDSGLEYITLPVSEGVSIDGQ